MDPPSGVMTHGGVIPGYLIAEYPQWGSYGVLLAAVYSRYPSVLTQDNAVGCVGVRKPTKEGNTLIWSI